MKDISILIVGVGGQGSLLTSRILGRLAQELGCDVKVSEVHGMAQRGGSVVTYVRMGDKVASPIIEDGGADYMVALESLEALRYVHLMKKDGTIVMNTQRIDPMPVITGVAEYPDAIQEKLESRINISTVDAVAMAKELGNVRVVNTIILGRLAKIMDIDKEVWIKAISDCVPAKTVELNREAFLKGY